MSQKKKENFRDKLDGFFKRVDNQDIIRFGEDSINTYSQPISKKELEQKRELQVLRQFLQQKNWNIRHVELYDEYRRMDNTFPIINAALRLYSQEVCLSGDTIVVTPGGDMTIRELYEKNKQIFYVKSFDKEHRRVSWNMVKRVVNNGFKSVYKVTVKRNIDPDVMEWDTKTEASFKCTGNHKIMVTPGNFKELDDLNVGDTIWSHYLDIDPDCKCKTNVFNNTVIEKIEYAGEEEVFDLVDVSPNHHFLIKLTDSFHVTVHNCTQDTEGNVISIISENKRVKELLEDCFFNNLKINSTSYLHVRSMLKFGNNYSFLDTRKGVGVIDLIHLPPEAIRIQLLQDYNINKLDDFKYLWHGHGGGIEFEPWEIVHWKNIEDIETEPYGQSILRSIVDTYRRIILMREAMIVYRITRAPQRFLFKIDTSGLDPDGALRMAENMKQQMYKKPLVNPVSGEIDFKYNPISVEENLYMPTFEGDIGDVRVLEGASNLGDIEDYKIIKDDLFAGLLIPKSYLTFEEDLCLREDTNIRTSEGILSIKELSELFEQEPDKKVYVLSCNKYGIITQGRVLWCDKTKEVNKLYRITVNGKFTVESTDNHPFLMEDLKYKRADLLVKGDSLKGYDLDNQYIVTNIEVITLDIPEYVYDLEVEEFHNFALEGGIFVHNSNKAALAQEDLRFAGAIKQYQSHYIEGLLHIGLVHLLMNGCSKEDLESFKIQMNTNSTLAEKTRNELLQQRFDLASQAWDPMNEGLNLMSFTQMAKEILHFTDEEIKKCIEDQMIEKKIAWRLAEIHKNGFYNEPSEDEKAKLLGMTDNNDVFSNLTFESVINKNTVKSILTEKLDAEIAHLTRKPTAAPSKKMIESVMSDDYSGSVKSNRFITESKYKRNTDLTQKKMGL